MGFYPMFKLKFRGFISEIGYNRKKAQQSHEIWASKSLESERATFQASDIESNLRWTPDRINASPCLQRYLDALPSGEYFGKGYQVVATDGSLRLNRSSTKEPAISQKILSTCTLESLCGKGSRNPILTS